MPSLLDWAEDQKSYIRLQQGQDITVKYISYRFKEDKFNPDKQTIEYKVELPNGKVVTWDNGTARVAEWFGVQKPGVWVKIQREGEGPKTRYHLLKVEAPVATKEDDSVEPEDIPF